MQWIQFGLVQIAVLVCGYVLFRWWKKKQRTDTCPVAQKDNSGNELKELRALRSRSLNEPLSEMARPICMDDIIGQENGVKALRAALCGSNPQHVLIYGPPGVGKTCAARLVLEEAKRHKNSPFNALSQFVEIDATCVRFDERAIADPLLGSVHDPIYQGAGAMGVQGIPQPKPGAVTRAHCGMLFLDEIGELHSVQMNKLLKVLEDRRVFFESSYYSKQNNNIPAHIHDIFQNGMPADFRLVGATTRAPDDIPSALRSRCVEIYFAPLSDKHLEKIAKGAAERMNVYMDDEVLCSCAAYSHSGRDAVNMVQLAGSVAFEEGRSFITKRDIEWVASTCHYIKKHKPIVSRHSSVGVCNGLGVSGSVGCVIEIECNVRKCAPGMGTVNICGAVEEEELEFYGRKAKRKSMARASVENVLSAFSKRLGIDCTRYDIRFNIPGGVPMDGPSAGVTLAVALMSALTGRPPRGGLALTGEVTLNGEVRGVGGVREKLEAAVEAGATHIIIPKSNADQIIKTDAKISIAENISEVIRLAFEGIGQGAAAATAGMSSAVTPPESEVVSASS